MSSASCRDSTKMFSPLRNANLNSSQIMNSPHPVLSDTSSKEYINLRKKPILLDADKPFNGSGWYKMPPTFYDKPRYAIFGKVNA